MNTTRIIKRADETVIPSGNIQPGYDAFGWMKGEAYVAWLSAYTGVCVSLRAARVPGGFEE